MGYEEWVEENEPLLKFLHEKVSTYVDVDFDEFSKFMWERRDKFK